MSTAQDARVPGLCPVPALRSWLHPEKNEPSTACASSLAADENCTQALCSLGHPKIQLLRTILLQHSLGNSEILNRASPDLLQKDVQIV